MHITRLRGTLSRGHRQTRTAKIARLKSIVGDHPLPLTPAEICDRGDTHRLVDMLQMLRRYRPGDWNPDVRLEGREHLERARTSGRGAIIWIVSHPRGFVAKQALHEAGISIDMLSLWEHDLSKSRWGCTLINPIRTKAEAREIADRIIIKPGRAEQAHRELLSRIEDGRFVGIALAGPRRRQRLVPLLNGLAKISTAPPTLALSKGIPIIPVFTTEVEDGLFVVTAEPPLNPPDGEQGETAVNAMIDRLGALLGSYVRRYPDQLRWRSLVQER